MTSTESFGKEPVLRLIARLGIPSVISMVVVIIYNMADTFFVGQTHNDAMVAAVSLAAPVFTLMITVGTLIGSGGCSVISSLLGAGDREKVRKVSSFSAYASILVGLLFTAVILIFRDPILAALGTTVTTYEYAKDYLLWIGAGAVFIIFSNTLSNIIRAEGASKESMIGNMIGTVANIILDPIMILAMDMGTAGAAIATIIGNALSALYYVFYFIRKKDSVLSISLRDFKAGDGIASSVISIGIPGALGNLLMSFSTIFMNILLSSYGDSAVAAMGVSMKVVMIVVMLQMGLATGVLPILSYSVGAGMKGRLKKTIGYSAVICLILGSVLTLLCFVLCRPLVSAFVTGEETISLGVMMTNAVMISGPVIGIYYLCISIMQAIGKPVLPIIVSLLRQGLIYIPLMYLLNSIMGLEGLIWTQPISDYASTLISIISCLYLLKAVRKDTFEYGIEQHDYCEQRN